jgi:hypothetical protein
MMTAIRMTIRNHEFDTVTSMPATVPKRNVPGGAGRLEGRSPLG